MQGNPPSSSHHWLLNWLGPIGIFLTATGGIIIGWFSRKRSGERQAQIDKDEAEAQNNAAEARLHDSEAKALAARVYNETAAALLQANRTLGENVREREAMRERHERRERILWRQVTYFENLESINRQRGHSINNELDRVNRYLTMVLYPILEKNQIPFERILVRSYEEVTSHLVIPPPPNGLPSFIDSGEQERPPSLK